MCLCHTTIKSQGWFSDVASSSEPAQSESNARLPENAVQLKIKNQSHVHRLLQISCHRAAAASMHSKLHWISRPCITRTSARWKLMCSSFLRPPSFDDWRKHYVSRTLDYLSTIQAAPCSAAARRLHAGLAQAIGHLHVTQKGRSW